MSDQRIVTPTQGWSDYPYAALTDARYYGLTAASALEQYSPTPAWQVGELFADVGYAELMFAENMCNGIPLATISGGLAHGTTTVSRSALLALALSHFDSAQAHATGSDSVLELARVGRGRALLDSGDFASAGAAVDSVPLTFAYTPPYDGVHQLNQVYSTVNGIEQGSVSNNEGGNGLPFVAATDPRVPITNLGIEPTGQDTVYAFTTYSALATPIVQASGIEAQLIVAEVALRQGNTSTWAATLNALRQSAITPSMQPLPADSTTTATESTQLDVMFRERAFWLFLTGHRHGDLRRLIRQYGRATESVFPTGLYQRGPSRYSTAVAYIPGGAENGNPTYTGCIDANP